jgi:hypothetical protein
VPTVELRGRRFRVRPQGVSLLSLMKFAVDREAAAATPTAVEGMAALYELLQLVHRPDEWEAFEAHANDVGADGDRPA